MQNIIFFAKVLNNLHMDRLWGLQEVCGGVTVETPPWRKKADFCIQTNKGTPTSLFKNSFNNGYRLFYDRGNIVVNLGC